MGVLLNSSEKKALLLRTHLWYNTEDKLQAYPPEYIYDVQRLVSSGWSGFRYRFSPFAAQSDDEPNGREQRTNTNCCYAPVCSIIHPRDSSKGTQAS